MEKLSAYNSKRDFSKTAEPVGRVKKSGTKSLKFVIQLHHARAKHFDFRLEWEGKLLSWAVPKGPSFNPKDKRLAVRVEDHPLDYASFEGTIPKGEYGGGTVMLWDEGEWQSEGDISSSLKTGSLKFEVFGKRIKGKWSLIRLKNDKKGENWLLIKEKDEFALPTAGISKFTTSVKSGRTMSQISKKISVSRLPFTSLDVMLAKLTDTIPKGKDYLFEIKYDGYRVVAYLQNGRCTLKTRNNLDYTQKFAEVAKSIEEAFKDHSFVLDGEMIVCDENGRSDFGLLQSYFTHPQDKDLKFMVFDLLALDGKDLREQKLIERKRLLKKLLKNAPSNICFSEHVIGRGEESFLAVQKLGLEGIVGKRVDSPYRSERNGDWLKIKCYRRQEFVIGGYEKSDKKAGGIGALLLGYFQDKELKFVGKAGTGIGEKEAENLKRHFKKLTTKLSPFDRTFKGENVVFLRPVLVAEIQFAQFTSEGVLRQASFLGLREDKGASEVVLEEGEAQIGGVKISSPERVVYPDEGITKGEIAQYYLAVSQRMLPYIRGRVQSVVRCHDNIKGEKFFKKHPQKGAKNIKIVSVFGSDGEKEEYFCVNDLSGLMSEVQSGTIEFHSWGSKISSSEKPDMLVFDLDPDEKMSIEDVRQGVRDLKRVLSNLGLKSFLKTSGGKGYHVVVPLLPSVDWDTFHDFARDVALLMEERWPDRYTSNIRKDARNGKIFIDWVRNGRGATSVAPYSLRARAGAPVSMPIRWSELECVSPSSVDMAEALKRIKKSDPWSDFFKTKQKLTKRRS